MRQKGSFVGVINEPATTNMKGVWGMREEHDARLRALWPMPLAAGLPPTNFANCTLWIDATDVSTLYTASAGSVLNADGQSCGFAQSKATPADCGNQSTSGYRPLYKTGIAGGLSGLRFDATDDNLAVYTRTGQTAGSAVAASSLFTSNAFTICAAIKITTATIAGANTWANPIILADLSGYIGMYVKNIDSSNVEVRGYVYSGGDKNSAVTVAKNSWVIVSVKHDGSNIKTRLNAGTWASTAAGAAGSMTGLMTIGTPSYAMGWDLAHLSAHSVTLSDADLHSVEQYFAAQIGLTIP